jgi:hypothetical protein
VGYDRPLFRPSDFSVWRDALAKVQWPYPDRYEKLLALLELEPDLFVYLSY